MKHLLCLFSIIILVPGLVDGESCRSGNYVMDKEPGSGIVITNGRTPLVFIPDTIELLVNGGFETGDLPPWESPMWRVTDLDSHSGQYCTVDVGNYWIRQNITPVLTDSILSITFWSRQPEGEIQAFDFIYSDSTYDEDIVFVQTTWQMFDVTSYVPNGKTMVALRIWGYVGGGPLIDSTYMDDISVLVLSDIQTIEENKRVTRQLDFNIHPNPVRDKAVIQCPVASGEKPLLSIYDIKGTVVEQTSVESGEYVWYTKGFTTGIYFVRIDTAGGQNSVKKVPVIK